MHKRQDKYGKWSVNLYVDPEGRKLIKQAGLKLKPTEDDDGNLFYRFSKKPSSWDDSPPLVFDADGEAFEGEVGNGSDVTIKIEVYSFKAGVDANGNPYSEGKGHRWQSTRIDNLIPYARPVSDDAPVAQSVPKNGIPF
jgi:hypothetical protein